MYLNFNYKRIHNTNKTIKKNPHVKKAAIYCIDFLFWNKRNMKKMRWFIHDFDFSHVSSHKIKHFACNLLSNLTSLLLWVVVSFFISYHNDLFFYRHKVHSLSLQVLSSPLVLSHQTRISGYLIQGLLSAWTRDLVAM